MTVVVAVSSKYFARWRECGDSEVMKIMLKIQEVLLLMNFILLGFFLFSLILFLDGNHFSFPLKP